MFLGALAPGRAASAREPLHWSEAVPDERLDFLRDALERLSRRQEELERRLANIELALGIKAADQPAPPPPPAVRASAPARDAHPESHPVVLETRMGLTWVNRVGAITLVLAIGFFFKYAVDNQWIGQAGRVAFGTLAGLLALALAEFFWKARQAVFAQGVTGAGIAILYVSFYASFGFYRLIPHGLAFLLMAVNTAAAGALALRYSAQAIALLGLLGGYLTPLLLSAGETRPWALFTYVLILDAGASALARMKNWRGAEVLALAATAALYSWWLATSLRPESRLAATVWALVFYVLFATRRTRAVFAGAQVLAGAAVLAIWPEQPLSLVLLLAGLCAAGLAVADRREWSEAPAVVFAAFWLAYAAGQAAFPERRPAVLIAAVLTLVFFLFLGWIPWRVQVRGRAPGLADLALPAANGGFYYASCFALLDPGYRTWMGAIALALAGVHFAAGRELRDRAAPGARASWAASLYLGIALAFLTLAAPVQLAGFRITVAWALEAAALAWAGSRARERRLVQAALAVFALVLVRLLVIDSWMYASPGAYRMLVNARFLAFLTAAVAFWLAARSIRTGWEALGTYAAGHFVMLWSLGLEALGWAARTASPENLRNLQSTSISILLAAYSVLLVSLGVAWRSALDRLLGLGLIGLVVLKLYFFDVWRISRMYRVAAFAVLGILLLVTSYLYSRFRASVEDWWRNERTRS